MKQAFKYVLFCLAVSISNRSACQTTDEDYNYVTKELPGVISKGLQIKEGYFLRSAGDYDTSIDTVVRTIAVQYLYQQGDSLICGVVLRMRRNDNGFDQYFCVPLPSSSDDLWHRAQADFWAAMADWDPSPLAFGWDFLQMVSVQAAQRNDIALRIRKLPKAQQGLFK